MPSRWWVARYDASDTRRITDALADLDRAVQRRAGFQDFFRALLTNPRGVPGFFHEMFEARGLGGPFYGRAWKPLSSKWLTVKAKKGWDSRIGYRKTKLYASLTTPRTAHNIMVVTKDYGRYGTRISEKSRAYADFFNSVRPFIDEQTMADIRHYLLYGEGHGAFLEAVRTLKANILSNVRYGVRS